MSVTHIDLESKTPEEWTRGRLMKAEHPQPSFVSEYKKAPDRKPPEISAGDVVCLKSGGPAMTVYRVDGVIASCCWFFDENDPQRNRDPDNPHRSLAFCEMDFHLVVLGKVTFAKEVSAIPEGQA
jgi:uncharacterized protein YodC (DUF2158 family)